MSSKPKLPALDPASVPAVTGSRYPEPFRSRVSQRRKQRLTPGMCAGFPAGKADGHCPVNRTDRDAVYLEVGDRRPEDAVTYPDDDLAGQATPQGRRFTRKDGTPYEG